MVDWLEVVVHTTTPGADIVSALLCEAGALGTAIEDRQDVLNLPRGDGMWDLIDEDVLARMGEDVLVKAYFEDGAQTPERLAVVRGRLAALGQMALGFPLGSLALHLSTVREEDWAENWKQYYKPFRAGERLVVKPSWEPYDARPGDLVLEMDPGMAFGTGTHETTFLCMQMLERTLRPGDDCIDVGTGTGILAIAAALLGARSVLAIDIDADAVRVAEENIQKNGVADRVRARRGNLLEPGGEADAAVGTAQVLVANIIADVVIALAAPARAHLAAGGRLICSGIIREREQDVRDALEAAGYAVDATERKGEWVCLRAGLR